MRIAICDPDGAARAKLEARVVAICDKGGMTPQVLSCQTGEQLLFLMGDHRNMPDIVLLDTAAPRESCIEFADSLKGAGFSGILIFTSSTGAHVYDAFDVGAYNYILKGRDVGSNRFANALTSAIRVMTHRSRKYILLNGISEHRSVPIDAISYIESNRHVCTVHYDGEAFEMISTLSKIEDILLPYGFVRIHRSYLVNCAAVRRYTSRTCTLHGGRELPIGRQHFASFKQVMAGMASEGVGLVGSGGR